MNTNEISKLKIIHLISGDLWAGSEVMAFNLLQRLNDYDDNLDITVILLNNGRLATELSTVGITVHIVDENLNNFPQLLKQIRAIVVSKTPDIIHSHRYKENLLAFLASRFSHNIKLISTQHGLPEAYGKKHSFIQRLISRANFYGLARYFHTVAVSKDIRNTLINCFGFRKDNTDVIHNGIHLTESNSVRSGLRPFIIGSAGRFFPVKDYPLMVEIALLVVAMGADDVRFELAGDGPGVTALEEMINSHGLKDRFVLRGQVDDMADFYCNLDVYLNTSLHEGIPMTIIEALSHGLPVIAPAVGGIVEIIDDNKDGFLINSRKPHDFADKCLLLKENRELMDEMKHAARKKAERIFSAEMMAGCYYKLYQRLADR